MISINEIIEKYLAGTISPDQEKVLFQWVHQSEENAAEFRRIEDKWQENYNTQGHDRLSLGRLKLTIGRRERQARNRRMAYIMSSVAAAVMVAVLLGFGKPLLSAISARSEKLITCTAPLGSKTNLTLADGTVVWINSGSSISYSTRYNKKERRVILEGEAFFDVVHDDQVPFIVESKDCRFTVLGTRFNVSSYSEDNSLQVVLVNGSLKFDSAACSDIMKPGDLFIYEDDIVTKKVIDPADYCSWVDGVIKYDDINVPDFINRLAREYNVNIKLRTDKFDDESFKASFSHDQSVASILEALCTIFPMKVNYVDNHNFFLDEQ